MSLQNCWEFKKCGREPGGIKTSEFGVCEAALAIKINGVHNGKNAGRACWAVTGTLCGGVIQGSFAQKLGNCMKCEFYSMVHDEEPKNLVKTTEIIKILN